MQPISVQASSNNIVRFPNVCVFCLEDASGRMTIHKKIGQQTRMVDVPVCERCQADLALVSPAETWRRVLAWPAAVLAALATLLLVWLFSGNADLVIRLPLLVTLPLLAAYLARRLLRHLANQAAPLRKRQVWAAVRISDFDSRDTHFVFSNPSYADRFRQLNALDATQHPTV